MSALTADDDLPIVIAGAGLHGAALAYYLTQRGEKPLLVDRHSVAAAASGKGGGFLARDWGSGPTEQLHTTSFALHQELAESLGITSYRKIPVLSVTPGVRSKRTTDICPWLDGEIADSRWMDRDGGAQVAPHELCTKLVEAALSAGASLRIGAVEGIEKSGGDASMSVSAVVIDGERVACRAFACTMGPWAALAQDWFDIPVPMTGIKSTSIVFKDASREVEPFALFCGEDSRFGTHLEVYPRNSGEVYLCGIGGSEYVDADELRAGKYPPGQVHADPARVKAATDSFSTMSRRLGGTPDTVQACMRPCPPDALPYMGRVRGFTNAYMSAGHNCWGILWAPVSGKAMSELILDGEASCVDLRPFDPARFAKKKSGGRGRKRGEESVGEQW
ncbi:hypothetical protein EMIHUDRAFT_461482 [Emiliania huxleyi CCMP1516]|uniref:FAD dependent oxidoreductase domain-containing protein n=2 Tax=Emiliania huxleyi TaxID=2903 RepID=A0A0D3ITB3_EMIH1|nr:hypothetical protein EMIHUDRAFT_461482 [Emiliania huxleyi CCMP1516]EOD14498.1 hypothetical protein EMIHUDRAFT_461482 [Emiliania huxleyi CCMP1516]|eukprot:XP_005766927.1 hypothetical protein EMIHUDRAFT_461482 [Emiliania huxleyi CCMP1516]